MSESVDLTQLHQQLHTSVPYGAPVSNWECFIAILHSLDGGIWYIISLFILALTYTYRFTFGIISKNDIIYKNNTY